MTVGSVVLVKIPVFVTVSDFGLLCNLLMLLRNSCMCFEMLRDFFKCHKLSRLWSSYDSNDFEGKQGEEIKVDGA